MNREQIETIRTKGWPVEKCVEDFKLFYQYAGIDDQRVAFEEWFEESEHQAIYDE